MKSDGEMTKPEAPEPPHRELGWARGEFEVPEDFNAPLPQEIEDAFTLSP